jgi:uncharacterized delta-60 repeat protein/RHS repeat-associated protein
MKAKARRFSGHRSCSAIAKATSFMCEPLEERRMLAVSDQTLSGFYLGSSPYLMSAGCTETAPNVTEAACTSQAGVRIGDGMAVVSANDISSSGFGASWGVTRSWNDLAGSGPLGNNWVIEQMPYLVQATTTSSNDTVVAVDSGTSQRWFDYNSGSGAYTPRLYIQDSLTHSGSEYTLIDGLGNKTTYYDFTVSPSAERGKFKSYTDVNGIVLNTTYDGSGYLTEVTRSYTQSMVTTKESWLYRHISGGTNDGLIYSVTLRRKSWDVSLGQSDGGTSYTVIRQADYGYYDTGDSYGNASDLQIVTTHDGDTDKTISSITRSSSTATVTITGHGYSNGDIVVISGLDQRQYNGRFVISNVTTNTFDITVMGSPTTPATGSTKTASNQIIDTTYYRYYISNTGTGYIGGLKYVVDPASFARLAADGGVSDPLTATDNQVATYSSRYFEYNSPTGGGHNLKHEVTLTTVQSTAGDTSLVPGSYKLTYATNGNSDPASGTIDTNFWRSSTTLYLPDSTSGTWTDNDQQVFYVNEAGQAMLSTIKDIAHSIEWPSFNAYNSVGAITLQASPAAVSSYTPGSYDDLVHLSAGNYGGLSDHTGLITLTTYYSSTNLGTGAVAGYIDNQRMEQGDADTAASTVTSYTYTSHTDSDGVVIYPVASQTDVAGGTYDDRVTTYTYSFTGDDTPGTSTDDTNHVVYVHTTLPPIGTTANGQTDSDTATSYYDGVGNIVFAEDGGGYIEYSQYDVGTGGLLKDITDVNTSSFQTSTFTPANVQVGDQFTLTAHSSNGSTTASVIYTATVATAANVVSGLVSAWNGSGNALLTPITASGSGTLILTADTSGQAFYVTTSTTNGGSTDTQTLTQTASTMSVFADSVPAGLSSGGSPLQLTTTYSVDGFGRTTKTHDAKGGDTYISYNDAKHEERTYSGWNSTTHLTSGPTMVYREDRTHSYTETLTMSATPNYDGGTNAPTGTESIGSLQSLARSYANDLTQVTREDDYFNLSGVSYSTSNYLGTVNTNYYTTTYGYDSQGRKNRVVAPTATISRTVYDTLGRPISAWIGTDDTGATDADPTGSAHAGNNMINPVEYFYDTHTSSSAVGNGNLTRVVQHPGGGADDRVTEMYYDSRNRLVVTKQGMLLSTGAPDPTHESTSVQRSITMLTYNNLDEVTKSEQYDGDTIAITASVEEGGSGDSPVLVSASSALRAQTLTFFDDQGRVYKTQTFGIDPSSGSVSTYALTTNTWFDPRGNVMKVSSPGGVVTKYTYDSANRNTITYTTDGGGDSGYSDADDVTGDKVFEQVENTFDANGNVILSLDRQRDHDETATGSLGSQAVSPKARVTYTINGYDGADRLMASVNVGAIGGLATSGGSNTLTDSTRTESADSFAWDTLAITSGTGSGQQKTITAFNGSVFTVDSNWSVNPDNSSTYQVIPNTAVAGQSTTGGTSTTLVDTNRTGATDAYKNWMLIITSSDNVDVGAARITAFNSSTHTFTLAPAFTTGTDAGTSYVLVPDGLITRYTYDSAGNQQDVVDPRGIVTRTSYDAVGRVVKTVENYVDGSPSDDTDQTTSYTYDGDNHVLTMKAELPGSAYQTTQYVYGVSGAGLNSNDVLGGINFPDKSSGDPSVHSYDQQSFTYNYLGEAYTKADQNGSLHTYFFDVLDRLISDAVGTIGSGVDTAVQRIEYSYDSAGLPFKITSYDDDAGGSVVNQIQNAYNGLGQLVTQYQEHSGSVNTNTSAKVQYSYDEMSGDSNNSRLLRMTYPDGRVIDYGYNSGIDDSISRLSFIADDFAGSPSTHLEEYTYLGLGTVVKRAHPQSHVDLSLIGTSDGQAGDLYTGLDRFGRVVDQNWTNTFSNTAIDRFKYGYDADSNVLYKQNTVSATNSELYHANSTTSGDTNRAYDGLNRLIDFARGTLSSSGNNGGMLDTVATSSETSNWDLDQLGNSNDVSSTGNGASSTSLDTADTVSSPQLGAASGWYGQKITVGSADLAVTDLGRLFLTGNTGTHSMKIVDVATGNDVPGSLVSIATTGGTNLTYQYATLGRPVVLLSGHDYYIVSQETSGGDRWYGDSSEVSMTSAASGDGWAYNTGSGWATGGTSVNSYGTVDLKYVLAQARVFNSQNQATAVGGNSLTYDDNGNTTTDETGKQYVYDAWNQQVEAKDTVGHGSTSLETFAYDGLGRKISISPNGGTTTDLLYSSNWQDIEEDQSGDAKVQNVWSPVYVDALVERDRDASSTTDGTLDTTFSGDGKQTSSTVGGNGRIVIVQPDGKILTGGGSFDVGRFNNDGSVDTGFGTSGNAHLSVAFGAMYGMALQSDGKIVAVGSTGSSGSDAEVARFNADGSLDTGFGTSGEVVVDFGGNDIAKVVAIQSDGKIVVAGTTSGGFVMRLNTNGSLDTSFDGDGKRSGTTMASVSGSVGGGMLIESDGHIIIAGSSIKRINPSDGSLDTGFSANVSGLSSIQGIALAPDGSLIVVDRNFELSRYDGVTGTLDTSFGSSGLASGNTGDSSTAVAMSADGSIYAGGYDGSDFVVERFDMDGTWDTSWGSSGDVTTDFGAAFDTSLSLTTQTDGKVLAAGFTPGSLAMARYVIDSGLNGAGLEERLYAIQDGNFNTTSVVNVFGQVLERYEEDPYGSPVFLNANWTSAGSSSVAWVTLHQGLRWDGTTELFDNREREYSPSLMRFMQVDTSLYVNGMNAFAVDGTSPTTHLDPNGSSYLAPNPTTHVIYSQDQTKDPSKATRFRKAVLGTDKILYDIKAHKPTNKTYWDTEGWSTYFGTYDPAHRDTIYKNFAKLLSISHYADEFDLVVTNILPDTPLTGTTTPTYIFPKAGTNLQTGGVPASVKADSKHVPIWTNTHGRPLFFQLADQRGNLAGGFPVVYSMPGEIIRDLAIIFLKLDLKTNMSPVDDGAAKRYTYAKAIKSADSYRLFAEHYVVPHR